MPRRCMARWQVHDSAHHAQCGEIAREMAVPRDDVLSSGLPLYVDPEGER